MKKIALISLVVALSVPFISSCANKEKSISLDFRINFDSANYRPTLNSIPFACIRKGTVLKSDPNDFLDIGKRSIFDAGWQSASIEMFDGSKNLIGVPDSFEILQGFEGHCSIKFKFSNVALSDSPIRLQSPTTSYGWDIPSSDWLDGSVTGQDNGGNY